MSARLRTCTGCSEALARSEFSKNQWVKGPGHSRCKGCVSGVASPAIKVDTQSDMVTPGRKSRVTTPTSTEFGRGVDIAAASKSPAKKTPGSKASVGPRPDSTTFGKAKTKSTTSTAAADEEAAHVTVKNAIDKEEIRATNEPTTAELSGSADQTSGEPSIQGRSKTIKVKGASSADKERGNIRIFFGRIGRGIKSWTMPIFNPCLKAISGQVVTEEDILMKRELEKEDKYNTHSLEGRS